MSRLKYTVYAESILQRHEAIFRPYLAEVGLGEEVLDDPTAKIPLSKYNALLELVAQRNEPCLGLRMGIGQLGVPVTSSLLGGFGHALRAAPDVRTMLDCASRYLVVHAQANELSWCLRSGRLEISYRLSDPSIIHRRQDAEMTLGGLCVRLRDMTAGKYALLRVEFAHPQPADISLHREVFQCPMRFGQPSNLLVWPIEMLEEPLRSADPRLYQALLPGLEEERRKRLADIDLSSRLSLVILANLSSGNIGLDEVASELCMSKRTLQRRLRELELEFADVVEEIRQARAIELVSGSVRSLTEIAHQLGYNEASSFTRAFRRWTGLTPREFRQQSQA